MRYIEYMFSICSIGFIIGFIFGMIVNAILLRNIPREIYLKDKKMRLRYGALNWAIAVLGGLIAYCIFSNRS